MNACEYYQELISRMLDDELSNKERAVLAEHLSECSECAAVYSAFSLLSDAVAADLVEPPEELCEDIMAHIRRSEMRKRNRQQQRRFLSRPVKNAITAAACVAVLVAAVGGVAVVTSNRSRNAIYESRMSQSAASGITASDARIDSTVISETPQVKAAEAPQQQVQPVQTPAPQQERSGFLSNILPDSWFGLNESDSVPAQQPVYQQPVATPYPQVIATPYLPAATPQLYYGGDALVVVTPAPEEAPVFNSPAQPQQPLEVYPSESVQVPPIESEPIQPLEVQPELPEESLPVLPEAAMEEPAVTTPEENIVFKLPAQPMEQPVQDNAAIAEPTPELIEQPVEESPAFQPPADQLQPMPEENLAFSDIPAFELPAQLPELPLEAMPMEAAPELESDMSVFEAPAENAAAEPVPAEEAAVSEEAVLPDEAAAAPASHNFSLLDGSLIVTALFEGIEDEAVNGAYPIQEAQEAPVEAAQPAAEAPAEEAPTEAESEVHYASYVERLLAEYPQQLCPLPQGAEADRVELLELTADGMYFVLQLNFYGEQIYIFSYDSMGNAVSFLAGIDAEDYERILTACYKVNDIG